MSQSLKDGAAAWQAVQAVVEALVAKNLLTREEADKMLAEAKQHGAIQGGREGSGLSSALIL